MKDRLRHVRWIGGGSGAGKSTLDVDRGVDEAMRLVARALGLSVESDR